MLRALVFWYKMGKQIFLFVMVVFMVSSVIATQCSVPMGSEEYEQYTCDSSESNYQELLKKYGGSSAGCSKCSGKSGDDLYTKAKESYDPKEIWTNIQDNGKLYGELSDQNKDSFAKAGLELVDDRKLYDKVWKENDKDEVIGRLEKIADQNKKEQELGKFLTQVFDVETKVESDALANVMDMAYKDGDIKVNNREGEFPLPEEMPSSIDKITIDSENDIDFIRFEKNDEFNFRVEQEKVKPTTKEGLSFEGAKGQDISPNTEYDLTDLRGEITLENKGTINFLDNDPRFPLRNSEVTLVFTDSSRSTIYPHLGSRNFPSVSGITGLAIGPGTAVSRYNVNPLSIDTFVGESFDVIKYNLYNAEVSGAGTVGSLADSGHGAKLIINGNTITPIKSTGNSIKFTPIDGEVWVVKVLKGNVMGVRDSQTYNIESGDSLMLNSNGYANPRRIEGNFNAYVNTARVLEAGLSAGNPSELLLKIQSEIAQITMATRKIMPFRESFKSTFLNMNSVSRNVRIALKEVGRV